MADKNKHLTPEMRAQIESALNECASFKEIGRTLGKDCKTISKDVRAHIQKKQTGFCGNGFNDCAHAAAHSCKQKGACRKCFARSNRPCWSCGKCRSECKDYVRYQCPKLLKPPYVCNGCKTKNRCTLEKSLYIAFKAQQEYETMRSESRSGFAISEEELKHLDTVVSPLLQNGHSLHHIAVHHADETMICERTMYTYVNNGLFTARNIDMPRTVRMRPRKGKKKSLKVDKSCTIDRKWEDYLAYRASRPDEAVLEIDSVEGIKGGKVLLTIHFVKQELQLAFLRDANDSQSVINIFEKLYWDLRPDIFISLFPILLADNGSEFSNPKAIEFDKEGNRRTRMFYCDPSAPYQKGACENNHEMIRRIIPKGIDFGRYTQDDINLMMSHINSYARKNLGDKSPYDVFAFQYNEDILKTFGLKRIPADKIVIRPSLLSKDV